MEHGAEPAVRAGSAPGPAGREALTLEITVGPPARRERFAGWGSAAEDWLRAELAIAEVGWRCRIVGPAGDASAAAALARSGGATTEEIDLVVTEPARPRMYCPRCGGVGPSGPRCFSCRAALTVTTHFSAHHAAVLGVPSC